MPPRLFSRVFCEPEELIRDSQRLRRRLGVYCATNFRDIAFNLSRIIERETGCRVPWFGTNVSLDQFFERAELRDVLDSVSLIFHALAGDRRAAGLWHQFVSRVFVEEKSTYHLGADGSVTYAVDALYAAARTATVTGLAAEKWKPCREETERAFSAMDSDPPDTNNAIRAIGAAVEAAGKISIGNVAATIGPNEIERHLWPMVQAAYPRDQTARDCSHQFLRAYADWVTSTHQYRHGQVHNEAALAPLELAVALLSMGCSILRWLVKIDSVSTDERARSIGVAKEA